MPVQLNAPATDPATRAGVFPRLRREQICRSRGPDLFDCIRLISFRRRTLKLSSGGGRVSYELRKRYMPPPSAVAPVRPPAPLDRQGRPGRVADRLHATRADISPSNSVECLPHRAVLQISEYAGDAAHLDQQPDEEERDQEDAERDMRVA